MTTFYFKQLEKVLKHAKAAAKHYCGTTLPSGMKDWAIYQYGKEIERCVVMRISLRNNR